MQFDFSSKAARCGVAASTMCILIGMGTSYSSVAATPVWAGSSLAPGPILKNASLQSENNRMQKKNFFQEQFGLGFTVIPVQKLWNLSTQNEFFQGGGSLDFFLRAHPQITLDLGIGGTGSAVGRRLGNTYGEFLVTLGPRIYIRPPPQNPTLFHQMYYVTLSTQFDVELRGTSSAEGSSLTTTFAFGFLAGVGMEFRLNSHIVFHVDMRVVFRGAVSPVSSDSLEMGARLGGGFGYFF